MRDGRGPVPTGSADPEEKKLTAIAVVVRVRASTLQCDLVLDGGGILFGRLRLANRRLRGLGRIVGVGAAHGIDHR